MGKLGFVVGASYLLGLSLAMDLAGCATEPHDAWSSCEPDVPGWAQSDLCKDAGTDGGDASIEDPGPDASNARNCAGRCVPFPSGPDAALWSRWPDSVWIGPKNERPSCPAGFAEQLVRFSDLHAPPAVCDVCECDPSVGECSGLPADIHVAAGACGDASAATISFAGPPGWDGSCTDVNALASGVQCPPGSNIPCAQSVSVSALPGPTMESCAVKAFPVPTFQLATEWKTGVTSCRGDIDETLCGNGAACARVTSLPWIQCIWRAGIHEKCPKEYNSTPYVVYPESAILDDRSCTQCECGPPENSECLATIRLYDDAACGSQFNEVTLSSNGSQCSNIYPDGRALGAKAITDLQYVPGTCAASGGEPIGKAETDDTQAITLCCLPPFYL